MTADPRRHDVWGDDPEERDADAVVAEIAATEPELERRWHDHPAVVPFKAIVLFLGHNARRIGITIAGVLVTLLGVALLVLPGPGWLLIFAGLAILATEYVWARRLLEAAKRKAGQAKDKVLGKKDARAAKKEAKRSGTS
jgi:uncharacterized protein (TIGR02611 family)